MGQQSAKPRYVRTPQPLATRKIALLGDSHFTPKLRDRPILFVLILAVPGFLLAATCTGFGSGENPSGQAMSTPIQFINVGAAAGIKFVHFRGNDGIPINREIFGPGVCVADFNGDGYPDIYFVNGRDLYQRGLVARNALYQNNGDGTFQDVTQTAGVPGTGYGHGFVWGDYDNDGFPDLYVTQYGRNDLYHNNGNDKFTDTTRKTRGVDVACSTPTCLP